MLHTKNLINLPIISIDTATNLGTVQDLYFDIQLDRITALFVRSEGGIVRHTEYAVLFEDVSVIGTGAVLVKGENVIQEFDHEPETWLRGETMASWKVQTTGGTPIGSVGDVLVETDGTVKGLALSETQVVGPVAEKQAIARDAIVELGHADNIVRIDLSRAETQDLSLA